MYCLLKMSTISRKGHSPHQQMFYHRNHRNLLFLCHPFRANYSMKSNNNNSAKCCILLDNLANKKCIIIQSRGLRFKVKSSENTSSNSADDENEEENGAENSKMNLQQILSKFKSKFDNEHKITYRKIIFSPIRVLWDNYNGYKEFVDNFNKEHAKSGYKIERDKKTFYKFHTLLSFPIMLLFQLVSIYVLHSLWLAYNNMKREHGPIMAQPSITFNQFAQDYLPSGEIDKIIHYPWKKLFVVLLHPGALINGEPFTAPGLHVKLDAFLLVGQLTQRIREEERRIGVRDSIPIVDSDDEFLELNQSKIICLYIIPGIMLYALKKMMLKQFWLVIPINLKKKGMMKK